MPKQRRTAKSEPSQGEQLAAHYLPSLEEIQEGLGQAESIDDFFGKEGVMARLFARTLEQMLEAELTAKLGYEKYEAGGRNSGNSRNGKRSRQLQTSGGQVEVAVPRDRQGEYQPTLLEKYKSRSNEIERKVIGLYAKGMSTRDIEESLAELNGIEVSAATISTITEQIWPLLEEWQSRPLGPNLSDHLSGCAPYQAQTGREGRKHGRAYRVGGRFERLSGGVGPLGRRWS